MSKTDLSCLDSSSSLFSVVQGISTSRSHPLSNFYLTIDKALAFLHCFSFTPIDKENFHFGQLHSQGLNKNDFLHSFVVVIVPFHKLAVVGWGSLFDIQGNSLEGIGFVHRQKISVDWNSFFHWRLLSWLFLQIVGFFMVGIL